MSKLGKYLIATGSVTSSYKPNNIYRKIIVVKSILLW